MIYRVLFVLYALSVIMSPCVFGTDEPTEWNVEKVMEIRISLRASDWNDLQKNALDEKAYPATVWLNGEKAEHVGLRAKGNSTLIGCVKRGEKKLPLKLDFSEYIPQTHYGMEVLNLNNEYLNPSFMHESISYEIFEKMGVPTPLRAYARVYVNDEYLGLYLAIENIGTGFTMRHYGRIDGELYKPDGSGANLEWMGSIAPQYKAFSPKTSYGKTYTRLIRMLDVLNNSSDKVELEAVLNTDKALRYLAVNAAMVNYDSYLASNPHNYYLYEVDGRFEILPWDPQMAFGVKKIKKYTDIPLTQLYIHDPTDRRLDEKVLIEALFKHPQYLEAYNRYMAEIAQEYLAQQHIAALTDKFDRLIGDKIAHDPNYIYDDVSAYEKAKQEIRTFAQKRSEAIMAQLEGTMPSSPPEGTYDEGEAMTRQVAQGDEQSRFWQKPISNLRQDILALLSVFGQNSSIPVSIDTEQIEDDVDYVELRIKQQEEVFRKNLILLVVMLVLIYMFFMFLKKKRRF